MSSGRHFTLDCGSIISPLKSAEGFTNPVDSIFREMRRGEDGGGKGEEDRRRRKEGKEEEGRGGKRREKRIKGRRKKKKRKTKENPQTGDSSTH